MLASTKNIVLLLTFYIEKNVIKFCVCLLHLILHLFYRLEQYDKNFNFLTPQLSQISVPVIILPPDEPFHDIKSDAILNLQ